RWCLDDPRPELEAKKPRFQEAAQQGRHPALTPYRELLLVHAVQRPLRPPHVELATPANRSRDQTFAGLSGAFVVDGPSTAKIELLAEWNEPEGTGSNTVTRKARVAEITVPPPGEDDQRELKMPIALRHEFGDTRHRRVLYQLLATSRFGEYFLPPPETNLAREGNQVEVMIPSSARPPAPRILDVVPTFTFTTQTSGNTVTSVRQSGLRVCLDSPWH